VILPCVSQEFFRVAGLPGVIEKELSLLDIEDPLSLQRTAENIRGQILSADFPARLARVIFDEYEKLGGRLKSPSVAARVSLTKNSISGVQNPLFLNISGEAALLGVLKEIWAGLYSAQILKSGRDLGQQEVAIIVQEMIDAQVSGVIHTVDTRTHKRNFITVEAIWGLGEYLHNDQIEVGRYILQAKTHDLIDKKLGYQEVYLTIYGNIIQERKVDKRKLKQEKLTDKELVQLCEYAEHIQKLKYAPHTSEWSMSGGKFYFLQSEEYREEIESEQKTVPVQNYQEQVSVNLPVVCSGLGVSPGIASGLVKHVKTASDIDDLNSHDIVVVPKLTADLFEVVNKAQALISERDGIASPIALLAREKGLPTVVAVKDCQTLKNGKVVTLDGKKGLIYAGKPNLKGKNLEYRRDLSQTPLLISDQLSGQKLAPLNFNTATKIYANLPTASESSFMQFEKADGVVQIKGEYLLANLKRHPYEYIENKKEDYLELALVKKLEPILEKSKHLKVWYHFSDITTTLAAKLLEGKSREAFESNPLLGLRGSFRHLVNRKLLDIESRAILQLRGRFAQLNVVVPMVRSDTELKNILEILDENGLSVLGAIGVYAELITPSSLIVVPKLIKSKVSGFVVNIEELSKLMLGVDPENLDVAKLYNPSDPSILWLLSHMISHCKKKNVETIICGNVIGQYPEFAEYLVKAGVTGIGVPADLVHAARRFVHLAERKMILGN
jgi:pyruvate,water dikinase